MNTRTHNILIAALGGEGGGVLADWIISAATIAGYPIQSTSIPGVAQRTGATTYYLEIFPQKIVELRARSQFSHSLRPPAMSMLSSPPSWLKQGAWCKTVL